MPSLSTIIVSFLLCFLFSRSSALHVHRHQRRAVTPPSFTVKPLGQATDAAFPTIHRDGGGGGVLNNRNWIIFSDTECEKSFASNTYATSEPLNPTNLTDFPVNGAPMLAVPWEPSENSSQDFIWPSTSLTARTTADKTGYAVYPFGTRCNADGCGKYNTLCQVTATDSGLEVERLIPQLFTLGVEPQFGTFSTTYDFSGDNLYLFSPDGRIAKVRYGAAGDKSQYSYWTGGVNYNSNPLQAAQMVGVSNNAPISGGMCGFSTGDVFYSNPYHSWVIIYMTSCVDSTFYIRYSVSGRIEGPYSDQQTLYKTVPARTGGDVMAMNYAGHAYPQFLGDRSGKEVLLSWTEQPEGGYQMGMATVTFS